MARQRFTTRNLDDLGLGGDPAAAPVPIPPGAARAAEPEALGALPPVRQKAGWIAGGLALQLAGAAIPAGLLFSRAKHDNVLHHITGLTVRLVWHELLRSHGNIALMGMGLALFVAGSIVLARPFVTSYWTLLLAVPVAAVLGLLALGVFAVIVAVVVMIGADGDWGWAGSGSSRKKSRPTPPPPEL